MEVTEFYPLSQFLTFTVGSAFTVMGIISLLILISLFLSGENDTAVPLIVCLVVLAAAAFVGFMMYNDQEIKRTRAEVLSSVTAVEVEMMQRDSVVYASEVVYPHDVENKTAPVKMTFNDDLIIITDTYGKKLTKITLYTRDGDYKVNRTYAITELAVDNMMFKSGNNAEVLYVELEWELTIVSQ